MFTFGLRPDESLKAKYWWGARAIFTKRFETRFQGGLPVQKFVTTLDLLYDRQSFSGPKGEGCDKFISWIDKEALPMIREWAEKVETNSNETFELDGKSYKIIASPRGSYGYMYIGAWSKEVA